ncbi:hypothetical protein [Lysinibacter cavernae]|uniref:Gram-positive cocci surface proteins LPxTG domain-containing protein n=1 Tax=Lysinibacter cavernae TaxID=1640652 RepID=A0A7X5R3K3_9MICO|nr:hypothetical protein [Lysinibacter cavernae]NIH54976.1 hypothetical protein [Lysinibacter cavernae]
MTLFSVRSAKRVGSSVAAVALTVGLVSSALLYSSSPVNAQDTAAPSADAATPDAAATHALQVAPAPVEGPAEDALVQPAPDGESTVAPAGDPAADTEPHGAIDETPAPQESGDSEVVTPPVVATEAPAQDGSAARATEATPQAVPQATPQAAALAFAPLAARTVTISGSAQVGSVLTATAANFNGTNGITYRWVSTTANNRDERVIQSESSNRSYTIKPADLGRKIFVDAYRGMWEEASSTGVLVTQTEQTGAAANAQGINKVDNTVSVGLSGWAPGTALTYAWTLGSASLPNSSSSLTLSPSQAGKDLKVVVTGKNASYADTTRTVSFGTVAKGTLTPGSLAFVSAPSVSTGAAAALNGWPADLSVSIEWRVEGIWRQSTTVLSIPLSAADLGKTVTLKATIEKPGYDVASKTVSAVVAAGTIVTTPVRLSGDARVGSALSVAADHGWNPAPASYDVQWFRNGVAMPGETGLSYTVLPSDIGDEIVASVSGSVDGYEHATRISDSRTVSEGIALIYDVIAGGPAVVGSTLSATTGIYLPVSAELSYQWYADGDAIEGETASTLAIGPDLLNKAVTVTTTVSKTGYRSMDATSPARIIQPGSRVNADVTVEGNANVGETLTARPGAWAQGSEFSYQWQVGGVDVLGATGSTFELLPAYLGQNVSVNLLVTERGYTPGTATSEPIEVQAGALTPGTVHIEGTPVKGAILEAKADGWPADAALSYQWQRNGVAIVGATAALYQVTDADVNTELTVVVLCTRDGYTPAEADSEAVSPLAGSITVSAANVVAGGAITITGSNFVSGAAVRVELHSTPVVLGEVTASGTGGFTLNATIPSGTTPGSHTVKIIDPDTGEAVAEAVLAVSPVTPTDDSAVPKPDGNGNGSGTGNGSAPVTKPAGASTGLAVTGTVSDVARTVGLGSLVLLLAGLVLLVARRRSES